MKFSKQILLVVVALGFFSSVASRAEDSQGGFSMMAQQGLRATLEKCLVRPYGLRQDGSTVAGAYRSVCSGVVREALTAMISVSADGSLDAAMEVRLSGSENSDGGDLWDVAVWDEGAHLILEARDVLAFGDPFEALVRLTEAQPVARLHDAALDEVQ